MKETKNISNQSSTNESLLTGKETSNVDLDRFSELQQIIVQQAQKIKDLQAEKEDAIAKANAERDKAIAQMRTYKGQAEFAQKVIIGIVNDCNSTDAQKEDTCDQINAYFNGNALPPKKGSKGKRGETFKKTKETFTVAIDDNETRNKTLIRVYNDCKKYKLIAVDTVEKDFIDIFSGVRTDATIKWVPGTGSLYYFFNRLKEKEAIDTPTGYGIWEVVKSHFVNKNGKVFTQDLASQKPPQKKDVLYNIMDIVNALGLGY